MNKPMQGRKLLILGGNPETGTLVEVANRMGVKTYVLDPNPHSPAKAAAQVSFDIEGTDIEQILAVVKQHAIDGVLVGVADILVPTYEIVCRRLGLPCYATPALIHAFSTKDEFLRLCAAYGIPVTPKYNVDHNNADELQRIDYPVMVKPVDNGGGVGMTVCHSPEELRSAVRKALTNSRTGRVVCEKYMEGADIQVYYTFVDGVAYLSSVVDRTTNKAQGNLSPVCIGALYNSVHLDLYLKQTNPKFLEMFKALGAQNGIFSIQCFVQDGAIYPYDPGFRLQGEGQHLVLNAINGFDHREMLVNFALTGRMFEGDFSRVNDVALRRKKACSVWILLKAGTIGSVAGLPEIRGHASFLDMVQRFKEGGTVEPAMLGTEKQVFARFYLGAGDMKALSEAIEFIHDHLEIKNVRGENMILDYYRLNGGAGSKGERRAKQ